MKKDSKQISPERLIEENMELAKSLAWEFLKRVPVEKRDWVKDDVFSAAYIGLTIAAGKYKAEFGTKFSTYHDVYYDGESHYYIDGSVYKGGKLLLLEYDESDGKYYQIEKDRMVPIKKFERYR